MPRTIPTLDLLNQVLEGKELSASDLDSMLSQPVREDLHLDYKHRDWAQKENAPYELRRYVSGFANAAGGLLIVGVSNDLKVTGCSAPGGKPPTEWAAGCVKPLAADLSPPPRFHRIDHPDGSVLVVATARSPRLVPCVKDGMLVYYMRLDANTVEVPGYLLADLVLGRRQHPDLALSILSVKLEQHPVQPGAYLTLDIAVFNESLSWADTVEIGLITWIAGRAEEPLSRSLLSYLHVVEPSGWKDRSLLRAPTGKPTIAPFEHYNLALPRCLIPLDTKPYDWRAGLYLVPRSSPPTWFQLGLHVEDRLQYEGKKCAGYVSVERLMPGQLARIAWEGRWRARKVRARAGDGAGALVARGRS